MTEPGVGEQGSERDERITAVVDQAHAEDWGGEHRTGFCKACAYAYLVAQHAALDTPAEQAGQEDGAYALANTRGFARLEAVAHWLLELHDGPRDVRYEREKPLAWIELSDALSQVAAETGDRTGASKQQQVPPPLPVQGELPPDLEREMADELWARADQGLEVEEKGVARYHEAIDEGLFIEDSVREAIRAAIAAVREGETND